MAKSPKGFSFLINNLLKESEIEKEAKKETWVTSLDSCMNLCVCMWSLRGLGAEVVKSENPPGSGIYEELSTTQCLDQRDDQYIFVKGIKFYIYIVKARYGPNQPIKCCLTITDELFIFEPFQL